MKVPRRRNSKKGNWRVSASGGVKFEPQMLGIPEVSSSHDDEEDEEAGIYRSSSDDDDDDEEMDDECDLRYLPREQQQRRRRQDQDGSFPSIPTFPAVLPQGDGSFPRMDDLARVGPLPTMFEGGSSAASSVTGSDKGGAAMSTETLPDPDKLYHDAATASPTSSAQTLGLGLDNNAHHPKSSCCCAPSMRSLKVAMSIALALLVLCMILIAVTILRQGRDDGMASPQDKEAGPLGVDIIANLPTAAPTYVPAPTLNTDGAANTAAPSVATTTAPATTKATTTAAPSLSPTMAPSLPPFAAPTLLPTNGATTTSPSIAPTGAPCADDLTVNFYINGISRNCAWLANSSFYQTLLCNPYNYMASTICPVTCQLCDVLAATNNTTTALEDAGGA